MSRLLVPAPESQGVQADGGLLLGTILQRSILLLLWEMMRQRDIMSAMLPLTALGEILLMLLDSTRVPLGRTLCKRVFIRLAF